jgi:hypothetical protein
MAITKTLKHARWLWLCLPLAALLIGAAAALALSSSGPLRAAKSVVIGDPNNRLVGTLNLQASSSVQSFDELPILWLGESFAGLNLVAFQPQVNVLPEGLPWAAGRTKARTALLVYGTCNPEASSGSTEVSCNPPLEIYISGPGSAPSIEQIGLHSDWSTPFSVRDVQAIDKGMGTELFFENGVSVTVYSDTSVRAQALQALTLANAGTIGAKPLAAGESLAGVAALEVTEPQ